MATPKLTPGCSVHFELTVTNPVLKAAVNDATVTVKVLDLANKVMLPSTEMEYLAGSSGLYQVTAPPITDLQAWADYIVIFEAEGVDSLKGRWEIKVRASKG